ncbi:MAG: hypothetical protein PQJ46_04035, partial [Spirochaetales bacterium]|nr:hypothetical protein [Spirochaetales bacterium]
MKVFSKCILAFLLFFIFTNEIISAEDILLPEEESSGVFINAAKDSDDVQLFMTGSWEISLEGGTGFGWSPLGGFDTDLCYSGITDGFSFSQSPDITISLLIINRVLFEAAFTEDFNDSTFLLGYRGFEDEFLQSVNVGNMKINMSEDTEMNDYFYVPGGSSSSFGIYTSFKGPFSEHQLLFRIDPQDELTKIYIGNDYVMEYELELYNYVSGQLFYIPILSSDVEFYFECGSEDADITDDSGRYFCKADEEDYSYSTTDGSLYLEDPSEGAVLVKSESANWEDLASDAKTIETSDGEMLLIYDPGIFSEFESAALFCLNTTLPEDSSKIRTYLADDADSIDSGIELSTENIEDDGIIIIEPAAGGNSLYPLYGIISDPDTVYGENSLPGKGVSDKKIIVQIREETDSYTVDDPVEGSIRIYINGVEVKNWEEENGTITFDNTINDSDRIEIVYKSDTGVEASTDILMASANTFYPSDNLAIDLNASGRINYSTTYCTPGEETSSYGAVSTGVRFDNFEKDKDNEDKNVHIAAGISAGAKLLTENSTGNLLIKNMSDKELDLSISRKNIYPSSFSELLETKTGISETDRGILLYKDYRVSTGVSSYYLQDYTTTNLDDSLIFSPEYSTSSNRYPAGPYTVAATSDNRSSAVLAMDYVLDDDGKWCGIQIPISTASSLDLSDANAVSFDWKSDGDVSDVDLYLEIGSISEDLDGDNSLDEEANEYSSGFIFNDPNSEGGTLIGGDNLTGSNDQQDSEDINDNGFIDKEKTDSIVLFEITDSNKPDSDWKRVTLYFSENSSSQSRTKLKNAEFIRITAINESGEQQSGRILLDDFRIEGASMYARDNDEYTPPNFSETSESLISSSIAPDDKLSADSIESDDENMVLSVKWDEDWQLFSYIDPVESDSYNSIVFYLHCPNVSNIESENPELCLNLLDSSGKGIKSEIPLKKTSTWQKVEIISGEADSSDPQILINDKKSDSSTISVDSDADDLYLLEINSSGTDSGRIFIDEITLSDPKLNIEGGVLANFEISTKDPVLKYNNIDVIGVTAFTAKASADY